jgi:hypothetical protein
MDEDVCLSYFVDPKTKVKRKKVKVYKYELITSHSCRSFVSNHIGKLPNSELCVWWMVNRRRDDVAL